MKTAAQQKAELQTAMDELKGRMSLVVEAAKAESAASAVSLLTQAATELGAGKLTDARNTARAALKVMGEAAGTSGKNANPDPKRSEAAKGAWKTGKLAVKAAQAAERRTSFGG